MLTFVWVSIKAGQLLYISAGIFGQKTTKQPIKADACNDTDNRRWFPSTAQCIHLFTLFSPVFFLFLYSPPLKQLPSDYHTWRQAKQRCFRTAIAVRHPVAGSSSRLPRRLALAIQGYSEKGCWKIALFDPVYQCVPSPLAMETIMLFSPAQDLSAQQVGWWTPTLTI